MSKLGMVYLTSGLILVASQLAGAAALSSGRAVFNWNSLWIDFDSDDSGAHINWSSWGSYSYAGSGSSGSGTPDYAEHELNGQVDTSALAASPNASGLAWTTDTEVGATADVYTLGQHGPFSASTWADGYRGVIFTAVGSGILTVKISYTLEHTLHANNYEDEAEGRSKVSLLLSNWNTNDDYDQFDEIDPGYVAGGVQFFNRRTGSFTVQGYFFDGNSGGLGFDASSNAYAGAPEPAMLSMLVIGGLAMLRRRRR